eukprot:CAMPEP_0171100730 /NCGR_PEP_ID=MMETSP0766_2-20121228/53128_1 /TAXON_ID=439317 /ORGANISM="Gambierdiscus australes, Strain CAWD 149" /LENGTH=323 /DNA_ID=CAMNT_0011560603 /DNA_START=115 /DNA_END=1083 /DNA_ORIENTATION=-
MAVAGAPTAAEGITATSTAAVVSVANGNEVQDPELEANSRVAGLDLEDHLSQNLICPISHRIMSCPVISPSGHSYDREPILHWLARRPVDPLSLTPLAAASLYPNRAIQSEVAKQLQLLAARAAAAGDARLAEVAQEKLRSVDDAKVSVLAATDCFKGGLLDRLLNHCACWATWWGILAWEQALVFSTSFGALFCLAIDAAHSVRRGMDLPTQASRPFLSTFVKLAVWPPMPPPQHWRTSGRLTVAALRGLLLLPVASIGVALTLGSIVSLTGFAQRCCEIRTAELDRASRSQWFVRIVDAWTAVTAICSFGLFARLYWDFWE